jgi:hypothetical protein
MGRAIVFHSPHLWDFAEEKNKFVPMAAQSARLVLTVFLISSSLLSMIELGHDVLHRFNNPFHQHRVRQFKNYQSHSLVDHHFPKMKFAYEMEESQQPTNNFIVLLFGFFHAINQQPFSRESVMHVHSTQVIEPSSSPYLCPPSPPPLG